MRGCRGNGPEGWKEPGTGRRDVWEREAWRLVGSAGEVWVIELNTILFYIFYSLLTLVHLYVFFKWFLVYNYILYVLHLYMFSKIVFCGFFLYVAVD